jgi:prephenate dehydratase
MPLNFAPRIAIQGELGSNSHMAALAMCGPNVQLVPCQLSFQAFDALASGAVDAAVLPIENSLHGSVAEHYDLLLEQPVRIVQEDLLRIEHHLIAAPGVRIEDVREVLSHPVALAQCKRFFAEHPQMRAIGYYDTAGAVKHVVEQNRRDAAALAPLLAAEVYGGEVLARNLEDHASNVTRFHTSVRRDATDSLNPPAPGDDEEPDKMTLAFSVVHRPGTLVLALDRLARLGVDLTRIESRPVPGRPWEYVFFVEIRFSGAALANAAVAAMHECCSMVKELGRYRAASPAGMS